VSLGVLIGILSLSVILSVLIPPKQVD